jgi:hypothetical protein
MKPYGINGRFGWGTVRNNPWNRTDDPYIYRKQKGGPLPKGQRPTRREALAAPGLATLGWGPTGEDTAATTAQWQRATLAHRGSVMLLALPSTVTQESSESRGMPWHVR